MEVFLKSYLTQLSNDLVYLTVIGISKSMEVPIPDLLSLFKYSL